MAKNKPKKPPMEMIVARASNPSPFHPSVTPSTSVDIRLWREGKAYVQVGESFEVVRRLLVARRQAALSSPMA